MGVRSKTLITVLLVGSVVGILIFQINNENLYKGQIFDDPHQETVQPRDETEIFPDLTAEIKIIQPKNSEEDLKVEATVGNIGDGSVEGINPFTYTISINEIEVFSNSDSYTTLEPGDSFSFTYPIPKGIYQYENEGTVKFEVDTDNSIKESNENNNISEKNYKY